MRSVSVTRSSDLPLCSSAASLWPCRNRKGSLRAGQQEVILMFGLCVCVCVRVRVCVRARARADGTT